MPFYRFRGLRIVLFPFLASIFLALSLPASAVYKMTPTDLKEMMPLKDVKPGMVGYGLTVFLGTKIERFRVRVVGVMPKVNSGRSLILVRMDGGPITSRHANIIQGMSGSPVYVNGRIIGAVSYGSSFSREPLAMVTPIEDMLDSWDPDLPARPAGQNAVTAATTLAKPVTVGGSTFSKVLIERPSARPTPSVGGALVMTPLMPEFRVSGMTSKGLGKLSELLAPYGLSAAPGPGKMPASPKLNATLRPGAAVGVSLACGDVDISGVGTVTYRKGNRIVAFGHPMLGIGALDAPMTTAYVHDVMPSLMISSKMASPVETVGRVSQDRQFSVGGEVGRMPRMVPVQVTVKDTTTKRNKVFNVKVINHPLLSAPLIAMVAGQAISEIRSFPGEATASVSFEVVAEEVGTIRRQNIVFDPMSVDGAAMSDLMELLITLRANRFYPVDVKSVKMSVVISDKRDTATIDRIFVKEAKYEPGQTVDVGVVLKPYKKDKVTKYIKVAIPPATQNGRATLSVRGGSMRMDMFMGSPDAGDGGGPGGPSAGPGPSGGSPIADDVKQMVKNYVERERNNDLVARLGLNSTSVNVNGEKLSFLPPALAEVMKSTRSSSTRLEREEVKVVQSTDYVVSGMAALSITVQRKEAVEKKSTAKPIMPGPTPDDASSSSTTMVFSPDGVDSSEADGGDFFGGNTGDLSENVAPVDTGMVAPTFVPSARLRELVDRARASAEARKALTSSPSPTISTSDKPDEKAVGRAAVLWTQTTQQDFATGLLKGITATSGNDLQLSQDLSQMGTTGEPYVWKLISDGNGGVYAGTGNGGKVIRFAADGQTSAVFDSSELEILALAKDKSGNLYAGTSPNGMVYRITPDGKSSVLLDTPQKHISALAIDSAGNVFAATGDKSQVYKISPDGKSSLFFSSGDQYAQALALDSKDNLYVGAATNGIVYKVTPAGASSVLYDAAEDSITALAVDAADNVFAAATSKPVVVKIPANGTPKVVFDKATSTILTLAVDASGNVLAQTQDKIYKIQPDEVVGEIEAADDPQLVTLAIDPSGKLFAGTANPGAIYTRSGGLVAKGVYESVAHDAKLESQWGAISWTAGAGGAGVALSTRSGNSAAPDTTWSPWSTAYTSSSGSKIESPAARYIQYRVEMALETGASSVPELNDVTIVYMPGNQAPTLKMTAPAGGEKWSKKQTLKWAGTDPDKDTLTYDIYYSANNGATWTPLKTDVRNKPVTTTPSNGTDKPAATPSADKPGSATPEITVTESASDETMAQFMADLGGNPGIPQATKEYALAELADTKDKPVAEPPAKVEPGAKPAPGGVAEPVKKTDPSSEAPKPESIKETSYTWDTKTVSDGVYVLKVVASDKTSNPSGALTAEKISDQIVVENKPPMVLLFNKTLTIQSDKSVKVEGMAWQRLVFIANAQYRVDAGPWIAVAASDGIFDSRMEGFTVTTAPLTKGDHSVEVKVYDAAGNTATQKKPVKIE